jgi:hypothetical protein
VEVIYNIIQGILYTVLIYTMIGYDWKADKFFYFLFFITASFNYFTLFGMMLVACTPSALLAGFLIVRPVSKRLRSPRLSCLRLGSELTDSLTL